MKIIIIITLYVLTQKPDIILCVKYVAPINKFWNFIFTKKSIYN